MVRHSLETGDATSGVQRGSSEVQRGSTIDFGDFLGHIVAMPRRNTYCRNAIKGSEYNQRWAPFGFFNRLMVDRRFYF